MLSTFIRLSNEEPKLAAVWSAIARNHARGIHRYGTIYMADDEKSVAVATLHYELFVIGMMGYELDGTPVVVGRGEFDNIYQGPFKYGPRGVRSEIMHDIAARFPDYFEAPPPDARQAWIVKPS